MYVCQLNPVSPMMQSSSSAGCAWRATGPLASLVAWLFGSDPLPSEQGALADWSGSTAARTRHTPVIPSATTVFGSPVPHLAAPIPVGSRLTSLCLTPGVQSIGWLELASKLQDFLVDPTNFSAFTPVRRSCYLRKFEVE